MADAGKSDCHTDILPKRHSVLDLIRVAFYVHQMSEAVDMIKDAADKGYEVSANLMAVSTVTELEIDQVLEMIAKTPGHVLVVVDSFGALYAEQIELLVKKYLAVGAAAGQGGRHPRPQQPAVGLRQHDRGDHPRGQLHGRHDGRPGPRRRQLPDGAADRVPAQSEVPRPAGVRSRSRSICFP